MSDKRDIEEKIKRLRNYKVYDNSVLKDISSPRVIEVNINRLANKGFIRKIGHGRFYKSENKERLNRPLYNNPLDQQSLRYKKINPSKHLIFKHLFWSNKSNSISLENYIGRILSEDSMSYFRDLVNIFGEREVLSIYLNSFKSKGISLPMVERLVSV